MSALLASFSSPWGVALDGTGNLYIADTFNYRIRKIAVGIISTIAGNGSFQYYGDNGLAVTRAIRRPGYRGAESRQLLSSPIITNFRIRNVALGVINTAAGNGVCCFRPRQYLRDQFPAGSECRRWQRTTRATCTRPRDRAFEKCREDRSPQSRAAPMVSPATTAWRPMLSSDRPQRLRWMAQEVFIADQGNNRVRKISGGVITTVAGGRPTVRRISHQLLFGSDRRCCHRRSGQPYVPSASDNRVYRIATNGTSRQWQATARWCGGRQWTRHRSPSSIILTAWRSIARAR